MDYKNLSVLEIVNLIKNHKLKAEDITKYYLNQIEKFKDKNAVLEVFDDALNRAREIDKKIENNEPIKKLMGVPVLIKDNIMYKGKICSNASKILEKYVAQFNSTVVNKLLDEGAIILGRTNMDEFAMGGSCEKSAYGPCKNAYDDNRVSGGSSGGSAVATALDMCAFALGSDTGGSVRQPASYNGVIGLKPTYARISRYGLVAFASSLDTIGIFTRNIKDNAYILQILSGKDKHDQTSANVCVDDYLSLIKGNIKGKKIAIIKQVKELVKKTPYSDVYDNINKICINGGAEINEVEIPDYTSVLSAYYTIAFAEASSNTGRFDGVKYTKRSDNINNFRDVYVKTRSEFLGEEVKRRVMLGNFVLSSKYYNAYYVKARQIAQKLKYQFINIFKDNDIVLMPTTYGEAFKIGSKISDPVSMYIEDMFTVIANIAGIPSLNIPCGKGENNLPLGLQVMAKHFNEGEIYNMADFIFRERGVLYE